MIAQLAQKQVVEHCPTSALSSDIEVQPEHKVNQSKDLVAQSCQPRRLVAQRSHSPMDT
jgi:hypothetical protein